MRKIFNEQLKIGAIEIRKIEIDLKSRDQIPKVLLGLQYIYTHEEIRKPVFDLLEELIPEKSRKKLGRNGMGMWEIFVLSCIKLSCDSFVTRTNVHFPTDISLMFDAIRKVMVLTSRLCDSLDLPGWKQSNANLKKIKKSEKKEVS